MYRRYDKVINTYQKVVVDYRRRLTTSFRWTSFPILDFPLLLQHKDKRKVARAVNRTTWKCRTLVWTNILVYPRGVKICPYSGLKYFMATPNVLFNINFSPHFRNYFFDNEGYFRQTILFSGIRNKSSWNAKYGGNFGPSSWSLKG